MNYEIDLLGDGIENPWNARTMEAAARMFGANCRFTDRKKLSIASNTALPGSEISLISSAEISGYGRLLALENVRDADSIYGFKMAPGTRTALIAGNERFGISQQMMNIATHVVQIPMANRSLNTLNVAAASAVALYYLTRGGGGKLHARSNSSAHRPDLLLLGPSNHVETGSALRSAAAFGWNRVIVEDRAQVWFDCARAIRAEGRGAARRGRNPICVTRGLRKTQYSYGRVSVISTRSGAMGAVPLAKSHLANGKGQLVIIPDETQIDVDSEDWQRFGKQVEFIQIETVNAGSLGAEYPYRLPATIAMAECARQTGGRL